MDGSTSFKGARPPPPAKAFRMGVGSAGEDETSERRISPKQKRVSPKQKRGSVSALEGMDEDTRAEWITIEGFHSLDQLSRLAYHRQEDIDLHAKAIHYAPNGKPSMTREEVWVANAREQWRTEREDAVLEKLYRSPFVVNSTFGKEVLCPWLFKSSYFGDGSSASETSKSGTTAGSGTDDRWLFAEAVKYCLSASPTFQTPNLTDWDKSMILAQEQQFIRKLLIQTMAEKKDVYAILLESVERSRTLFWSTLEMRQPSKPTDTAPTTASLAKRIHFSEFMENVVRAGGQGMGEPDQYLGNVWTEIMEQDSANVLTQPRSDVTSRIGSLKQHHYACIIQAAVRRYLHRRQLRAVRQTAAAVKRQQEAHIAKVQKDEALRTLQLAIRTVLAVRDRKIMKIQRLTLYHQTRTIQRWYRFRLMLRRNRRHLSVLTKEKQERDYSFTVQYYGRKIKGVGRIRAHLHTLVEEKTGNVKLNTQRLKQWDAAVVIQKWVRRLLAQRFRHRTLRRVVRLQQLYRVWHCWRVHVWWKRQAARLRRQRRRRRAWQTEQNLLHRVEDAEESMVLSRLFVMKEVARVNAAMEKESRTIQNQFNSWSRQMTRYYINKKALASEWVVQQEAGTGKSLYFNSQTGTQQLEHPHMKIVRMKRKQEKKAFEACQKDRLSVMEGYKQQLLGGEERQRRACNAAREASFRSFYRAEREKEQKKREEEIVAKKVAETLRQEQIKLAQIEEQKAAQARRRVQANITQQVVKKEKNRGFWSGLFGRKKKKK